MLPIQNLKLPSRRSLRKPPERVVTQNDVFATNKETTGVVSKSVTPSAGEMALLHVRKKCLCKRDISLLTCRHGDKSTQSRSTMRRRLRVVIELKFLVECNSCHSNEPKRNLWLLLQASLSVLQEDLDQSREVGECISAWKTTHILKDNFEEYEVVLVC